MWIADMGCWMNHHLEACSIHNTYIWQPALQNSIQRYDHMEVTLTHNKTHILDINILRDNNRNSLWMG